MGDVAGMADRTRALVVVNAAAGGRATLGAGTTVAARLGTSHDVTVVTPASLSDAIGVVAAAVVDGVGTVVAVGGDGTVHGVVNGMVDAQRGEPRALGLRLGVVASGTGADFARTFGLHLPAARAADHVASDATMPIDLARVRCIGFDGQPVERVVANIVNVGWAASVAARAGRMPRVVGRARYGLSAMLSSRQMRVRPVELVLDHTTRHDAVCQVVIANGQFFGAGFRVAPRALPDDGRLHVQTWATSPMDVLAQLPKVRVGEHLDHPQVREWQSSTVRLDSGTPLAVEADGEPIGRTPATVDVLGRIIDLSI